MNIRFCGSRFVCVYVYRPSPFPSPTHSHSRDYRQLGSSLSAFRLFPPAVRLVPSLPPPRLHLFQLQTKREEERKIFRFVKPKGKKNFVAGRAVSFFFCVSRKEDELFNVMFNAALPPPNKQKPSSSF